MSRKCPKVIAAKQFISHSEENKYMIILPRENTWRVM